MCCGMEMLDQGTIEDLRGLLHLLLLLLQLQLLLLFLLRLWLETASLLQA